MVQHITAMRGTERATLNLAGILLDCGHDVTIVSTFSTAPESSMQLDPRLNVVHLGIRNEARGSNVRRAVKFLVTAVAYMRYLRPGSTVIGTESALTAALALASVFRPGVRLLGWEHMTYETAPQLARQLRRIFYPRLAGLVVLNASDRANFTADGLRRVIVIPNPVPVSLLDADVEARSPRLLAVGANAPDKGFAQLIRMAAPVLLQFPEWRLAIIGPGVPDSDLVNVAREAKISDRVELLPPRRTIDREYAQASICLVTSEVESFSMVIAEAKAHGVPSVAFDCPHGPRELIRDGVDGFLVSPGHSETFTLRLADLVRDPVLRANMSAAARASAARFTPDAIYAQWRALLT